MAVQRSDQLGMDERTVEDPELADLLEKRLRAQDDKREIAGVFKLADQAAKEAIARLEMAEEDAVRVGRFRITKKATEGRHVEFDAAAGSRISISLWAEAESRGDPARQAPAKPRRALHAVRDDEDLRPTGEVNADALRGEVNRASSDPGDDLLPN